jgi:hypothetical protein
MWMMVSDEQDPGPPASFAAYLGLYVVHNTLSSGLWDLKSEI